MLPLFCFALFSLRMCRWPGWHSGKESACQCRRCKKCGFNPSPGEGNGNPLQYSSLENSMDRGGLVDCSPRGRKKWDMTENTCTAHR